MSLLLFAALFSVTGKTDALNSVASVERVVFALARDFSGQDRVAISRTIVSAARQHGVAPNLVLAVIQVESSFRRGQRSRAGALGLMQVMPKTGREWARRLGIPWRGKKTLLSPLLNIRIGTAYLSWLLARFSNEALALTGYCHGPKWLRRALKGGGPSDRRLRYSRKVKKRLLSL